MLTYDKMINSGVDWLGKLPADWDLSKVSVNYRRKKVVNTQGEELLSVYRDYGVIPKSSRDDNHNTESDDLSKYQLVQPDDLVTNKMKTWQGSIAVSDIRGIVSPAYYIMSPRTKNYTPRYVHYLLRSPVYVAQYRRLSKGIRVGQWDLEYEQFKNLKLPLPPKSVQIQIANFLDKETAKIDNLIAQQERLLELLEEKRRDAITHAVTRGQDTGTSFSYVRIKNIAHAIGRGASPDYDDKGEARFINQACVYWSGLRFGNVKRARSDSHRSGGRGSLKPNDILVNSTGTGTLGRAALFNESGSYFADSHVTLLRPNVEKASPLYIRYLMESEYMQTMIYELCVSGSTNQIELSKERFANLRVLMPSLIDQEKIAEKLRDSDEKMDILKHKLQAQISLLRERRTSLISHTVTGKVKV